MTSLLEIADVGRKMTSYEKFCYFMNLDMSENMHAHYYNQGTISRNFREGGHYVPPLRVTEPLKAQV